MRFHSSRCRTDIIRAGLCTCEGWVDEHYEIGPRSTCMAVEPEGGYVSDVGVGFGRRNVIRAARLPM